MRPMCHAKPPEDEEARKVAPRRRCQRTAGHSGSHRSKYRQWDDGDRLSEPRLEHYRSPIA